MSSKTGVIDSQLDLLSDVLEDFCTKHNIEFMSADDILYGSSDDELSNYQKDWLRNYISIWDTIVNLWGLITMFKSESFGRIFWVDDSDDFKSCPQNIDGTGDLTSGTMYQSGQIGKELIMKLSLIFIRHV